MHRYLFPKGLGFIKKITRSCTMENWNAFSTGKEKRMRSYTTLSSHFNFSRWSSFSIKIRIVWKLFGLVLGSWGHYLLVGVDCYPVVATKGLTIVLVAHKKVRCHTLRGKEEADDYVSYCLEKPVKNTV